MSTLLLSRPKHPSALEPGPAYKAKQDVEAQQMHNELKADLQLIVQKQRTRIENLKVDSAVQIEHQATLRRRELENRLKELKDAIRDITPVLEQVRNNWTNAKASNSGYETTWSGLKMQHSAIKARVDVLRDSLGGFEKTLEDNRRALQHMKEHIQEIENDKVAMRAKVKRALECVVIDEDTLGNRIREEEQYLQQLLQAHRAMEVELSQAQALTKRDVGPLEDEVRILADRLKEMQTKTADLFHQSVDAERRLTTLEEESLSSGYNLQEDMERAGHLLTFKNSIINSLEKLLEKHRIQHGDIKGQKRSGQGDVHWLSHSVTVWEFIVHEAQNEKQRLQMKPEPLQRLAETTTKCHEVKATLNAIRTKVFAAGPAATSHRKRLVLDLSDMRALISEKKQIEDQLMRHMQELCLVLNEDLATVMRWVKRETFDDYVSSTDGEHEIEEDDNYFTLREETNEDVNQIRSSLDFDMDDPYGQELLKQVAHRPEGPLREFAARRALQMQQGKQPSAAQIRAQQSSGGPVMETFERSMMNLQTRVASEVVNHVRRRFEAIQSGSYDPRLDKVAPDAEYFRRIKDQRMRVETWKNDQKAAAMGIVAPTAAPRQGAAHAVPHALTQLPQEGQSGGLAGSNPVTKATQYLTRLLQGNAFLVYFRNGIGPHMRHVFLGTSLTRVVWRRIGVEASEREEDGAFDVSKIVDVTLGHQTDVFREHRSKRAQPMPEDNSFSLVCPDVTLDLQCETIEERNYWAQAWAWVINESHEGGVIASLRRTGRIIVLDAKTGSVVSPGAREVGDRSTLQVQIAPAVQMPGN